jgi:hypothetical protein
VNIQVIDQSAHIPINTSALKGMLYLHLIDENAHGIYAGKIIVE